MLKRLDFLSLSLIFWGYFFGSKYSKIRWIGYQLLTELLFCYTTFMHCTGSIYIMSLYVCQSHHFIFLIAVWFLIIVVIMIAKVTVLSILLLLLSAVSSSAEDVKVTVQGVTSIANTDDNFVCATIDWWPINKCDYNQCPWGKSGVLNLVFFFFFSFFPMLYTWGRNLFSFLGF